MKKILTISLALLAVFFAIYGIATSQWYLTALPIGFMLGFFLQKGDLCASSAMSEVIMFKDKTKLWGFWVAIATTMLSLSIIDAVGWINVNPKHFLWMSNLIGGLVFGVGMVFAGGCISGVLYKGATGNINSIMALMGIPFGIATVEFGPLNSAHEWMQSFVIKGAQGEALTLYSITNIPYLILAILFVAVTILYPVIKKKKFKFATPLNRSWKPWVAGVFIGVLSIFAYLSSDAIGRNYSIGITHGVLHNALILMEKNDNLQYIKAKPEKTKQINEPKLKSSNIAAPQKKKINMWLVLIVLGLFAGSLVSSALSGQLKLLPKDPTQTLFSLLGGFMIGIGAAFAGGCSIGNILSGWGMMSLGNFIFGIVALLANWATTYFYLIGSFSNKK